MVVPAVDVSAGRESETIGRDSRGGGMCSGGIYLDVGPPGGRGVVREISGPVEQDLRGEGKGGGGRKGEVPADGDGPGAFDRAVEGACPVHVERLGVIDNQIARRSAPVERPHGVGVVVDGEVEITGGVDVVAYGGHRAAVPYRRGVGDPGPRGDLGYGGHYSPSRSAAGASTSASARTLV